MRHDLGDNEWGAIKPMFSNRPRGVPRVNGRWVLNGIFPVLEFVPRRNPFRLNSDIERVKLGLQEAGFGGQFGK